MEHTGEDSGSQRLGQSYILSEILHEILRLATAEDNFEQNIWSTSSKSGGLAICRTCKRFQPVGQAILYEKLAVSEKYHRKDKLFSFVPLQSRAKSLYQTLKFNHKLHTLCKHLALDSLNASVPQKDISKVRSFLSMLTNLKSIAVRCNNITWPLVVNSSLNWSQLESLDLSIGGYSMDSRGSILAQMVNDAKLSQLRTLRISDMGFGADIKQYIGTEIVPGDKRSLSALKFLEIEQLRFHPTDLQKFLSRPAALEMLHRHSFEPYLAGYDNSPYASYDTQALMGIFSAQKDSLRHIETSQQRITLLPFDFRDFPLLGTIRLSWCSMPDSPTDAALRLCGPSLRLLKLDFNQEDQQRMVFDTFTEETVAYLQNFTTTADNNKSALRELDIIWHQEDDFGNNPIPEFWGGVPDDDEVTLRAIKAYWHPWLCMRKLRDLIAPLGFKVNFPEPDRSFEEITENLHEVIKGIQRYGSEDEEDEEELGIHDPNHLEDLRERAQLQQMAEQYKREEESIEEAYERLAEEARGEALTGAQEVATDSGVGQRYITQYFDHVSL